MDTQELKQQLLAALAECKDAEQSLELVKDLGIELSDEDLEKVTGGLANLANAPALALAQAENKLALADFQSELALVLADKLFVSASPDKLAEFEQVLSKYRH